MSNKKYQKVEDIPMVIIDEFTVMDQHECNCIGDLTEKIRRWAVDRMLHTADPKGQMIKLYEELGELSGGIAKNQRAVIFDSIGDAYVVLTILAMQFNMDIKDCIEQAWDEIKDRKGRMINEIFVKESDLPKD